MYSSVPVAPSSRMGADKGGMVSIVRSFLLKICAWRICKLV